MNQLVSLHFREPRDRWCPILSLEAFQSELHGCTQEHLCFQQTLWFLQCFVFLLPPLTLFMIEINKGLLEDTMKTQDLPSKQISVHLTVYYWTYTLLRLLTLWKYIPHVSSLQPLEITIPLLGSVNWNWVLLYMKSCRIRPSVTDYSFSTVFSWFASTVPYCGPL